MANNTDYLDLSLLEEGELRDQWGDIVNSNFEKIDQKVNEIGDEIEDGRGASESLNQRISKAVDQNGDQVLHNDVALASDSLLYDTDVLDNALHLDEYSDIFKRIGFPEYEIHKARFNQDDMAHGVVNEISKAIGKRHKILYSSGSILNKIDPTTVIIEPSSEDIHFEAIVDRKYVVIKKLQESLRNDPLYNVLLDFSGKPDAIYYIWVQAPTDGARRVQSTVGDILVTGESQFRIVGVPQNVSPGDILVVNDSGSINRGRFIIASYNKTETSPGAGDEGIGTILGKFNDLEANVASKKTYYTWNPFHTSGSGIANTLTVGAGADEVPEDALVIGEVTVVSGEVDLTLSYSYLSEKTIDLGQMDIADFFNAQEVVHNFGEVPSVVEVYARQNATDLQHDKVPLDRVIKHGEVSFKESLNYRGKVDPEVVKGITGNAAGVVPPAPLVQDVFPTLAAPNDQYTKNIFVALGDTTTIKQILLISDTAAQGSDVNNSYWIQVRNITDGEDLLSTVVDTFTNPISANIPLVITPDQNEELSSAHKILQIQITRKGTMVALHGANIQVVTVCDYKLDTISFNLSKISPVKADILDTGQVGLLTRVNHKKLWLKSPDTGDESSLYMDFDRNYQTEAYLVVKIKR